GTAANVPVVRSALLRLLDEVSIYVKPSSVFTNETADFMQPDSLPIVAGSGNKLDRGMVGTLLDIAAQLQAQPFHAGGIAFQAGRTSAGMPGFQQIIEFVQHECCVSGSHQRWCIWSHQAQRAMVPASAAGVVAVSIAAGAGRKRRRSGDFFHWGWERQRLLAPW